MPSVAESQLRRARAELESDLRAGRDRRAETLIAAYPAVAADTEAALELVYTEFVVRQDLGQNPDPSSWLDRFPQWRTDLEQMFQVHDELCRADANRPSPSRGPTLPAVPLPGGPPLPFAGYEITGELGRGGMGVVYKARQVGLNRVVAPKLILSGSHAGAKERERFRREAEAAARLDHPGIVRIYEVGENDGRPFCTMEYVTGGNLADRLKGTPWPARPAAEVIAAVARAADHAHQRGIVHRDLKPANILLQRSEVRGQRSESKDQKSEAGERAGPSDLWSQTSDLCPKVADFGLAKSLTDSDPGPTRTGDLLGTPTYMAPEQAEGRPNRVGPGTDIWAVGVVLYELLAGHPPFQGETGTETLRQVRTADPVPPSRVRPDLPRDLETICLKCLEKDPVKRYTTAGELADDLGRWLRGEPVRARPVGAVGRTVRWCRRNPRVAVLSGVVAAMFLAAVGFGVIAVVNLDAARTHAGKLAEREREARERAEQDARNEETARAREKQQVARLHAAAGARRLEDGDVTGAAVSFAAAMEAEPDPAAADAHRRRLAALLTACPRVVRTFRVPTCVGRHVRVSDDGTRIHTFTPTGDPQAWEAATAAPQAILIGPHTRSDRPFTSILSASQLLEAEALSADGRVWAVLSEGKIRAWDTATGKPKPLPLAPGEGVFTEHFSPDGGKYLAVGPDGKFKQLYTAAGEPVGERFDPPAGQYWHTFSPNGKWVATWGGDGPAHVWAADTGRRAARLDHPGKVRRVVFTPDGTRAATGGEDGTVKFWSTAGWARLGFNLPHGPAVAGIIFSPDGRRVLTADPDGGLRLWNAATGRPIGARFGHGVPVAVARFSPDGREVVTGCFDRTVRVWDADTATPLTAPLPHARYGTGAFAPDGRLVTAGGDGVVRVWEDPGAARPVAVRHTRPVTVGEWVLGGRAVLTGGGGGLLRVCDPATGEPLRTLPHKAGAMSAAVAPDGRRAVSVSADGHARLWDLATGDPIGTPVAHPQLYTVNFPADDRFVTGGRDGRVRVWDAATRAVVTEITVPGVVTWMQFTPDGRRAVIHGTEQTLWDVPGAKQLLVFPRDPRGRDRLMSNRAVLSADGRLVGFLSSAGKVRFYRTEDGAADGPELDVGEAATEFTFSPDAARFAVREPGTDVAQVWDRAAGRRLAVTYRTATPVTRIAFRPDGKAVATAHRDDTVRLSDVETGLPLGPPLQHGETVLQMRFSPDGRRLLTTTPGEPPTGAGATARVWDLEPPPRPGVVLADEARFLAGRRLDEHAQLVPLTPAEEDALWVRLRLK